MYIILIRFCVLTVLPMEPGRFFGYLECPSAPGLEIIADVAASYTTSPSLFQGEGRFVEHNPSA